MAIYQAGDNMKFNYNDGGRKEAGWKGDTGDCVCRAIAIALEKPYQEVYDELNTIISNSKQTKKIRGTNSRTGVCRKIYENYLKRFGWFFKPCMAIGSGCKVHLKSEELPNGRIIARLSRHLVAVINGVINDLDDCSRNETRCVYGYYYKEARHEAI
jgi:hypothetical protein